MATIEQAEELVRTKQFAAAQRVCETLQRKGHSGLRIEFLLGSIALFAKDFVKAKAIFATLAARYPNHSGVLNNLGTALQHTGGDPDEAQTLIERALKIDPANVPALVNLGELYLLRKRRDDAQRIYRKIVDLAPDSPQGYHGLGLCALALNDFVDAQQWLEKAQKFAPNHPAVISSLLTATTQTKGHNEAIEIARHIVRTPELESLLPTAWAVLKRYCQWDEAAQLLPGVITTLRSEGVPPEQFSPIALELLSSDQIDHTTLKLLHIRCGDGIRMRNAGYAREENTAAFASGKRMRIGYLSGDFRNHVAAQFIRGIINHHDPSRYEVFLYSSAPVSLQDETTGKFFRVAEHFVHCHEIDDGELARQIARDGIHVLIDLSGYTSHTRMSVLALKPAPVQMTYVGYPATYGLQEVDYIICNCDLVGSDHAVAFVEAPIELPGLYGITPSPPGITRPAHLPAVSNEFVTFGSLINPYKINRSTVTLWARVMSGVPASRLYLNHPIYGCKAAHSSMIEAFAMEGISADRLTVTDERPANGGMHFLLYDNIDIVLDATPMTGGAGTADALIVGVPVVSRIGTVFHERLSAAAIRANVPNPEDFIAVTDAEFIDKAIRLAKQPEKLGQLRQAIRNNVLFGPNAQADAFTGELEGLLQRAWDQKFPDTPIDSLCTWETETETISAPPLLLQLPAARNNLYRFVALEKGRWFEDECGFIVAHASDFGIIWDISDDPGLGTLPIAANLQEGQELHCVRKSNSARLLIERNKSANGLSHSVHVVSDFESLSGTPVVLRVGAEHNDGQASILQRIFASAAGKVPLILISLDSASGRDFSSADFLAKQGYMPFRLHAGCNILVEASPSEDHDGFRRNLFYVLPEAVSMLEEHGLLCSLHAPTSTNIPAAEDTDWVSVARPATTSADISGLSSEWSGLYLSALNAYARSQEPSLRASDRLSWFNLADQLVQQLLQVEPTVPRLLTAIRLANEAGRRDKAVQLAREAADSLNARHGRVLFEPYLPPSPETINSEPVEDEAVWAQSVFLITLEKLRSWSAFFTAAQSTHLWKELRSYPWCAAEAEKMLGILNTLWQQTSISDSLSKIEDRTPNQNS